MGAVSVSPKISWGPVVESRALASFFGCAMPPDPIGVARCCEPRKWGRPLSGALKVARPPQRSVPRDIHHLATLRALTASTTTIGRKMGLARELSFAQCRSPVSKRTTGSQHADPSRRRVGRPAPLALPEAYHREPVCAFDPRRGDATDLATGELCTFLCASPSPRWRAVEKTRWKNSRGRPVRLRLASFPANALPRQNEDARTAAWL